MFRMRKTKSYILLLLLILHVILEPISSKRGGGGFSLGRGSSSGRKSNSGTGGGIFGAINRNNKPPTRINTNSGWGNRKQGSGNGIWASSGNRGNAGIFGGNRNKGYSSSFSKSGLGSRSRSSAFKNAIVGAAAGYLTYQAGKAIIRNIAGPMMWNNRPYYWGSQYYRPRTGHNMCRMPIPQNDENFGNIYSSDGMSRPKEIVWDCGYNEHCCGYECCPGSGGYGGYNGYYNHGMRGFGIGGFITFLILLCCGAAIVKRMCFDSRRNNSNNYTTGPYADRFSNTRTNIN
uniref:CX domain-containing protein n=1 Tax=Strongyloides venezuelensis TaxID=75913 RepID=A0A0K0F6Z6_STRVS